MYFSLKEPHSLSILSSLKQRFWDTTRPPRSWFHIKPAEPSSYKQFPEEGSRTLRRTMFVILGFSLFSVLSLLQPDEKLLATNATIKLPFGNVDIGYVGFLIAGPAVLIGFWFYQQVFQDYLQSIPSSATERIPYVFNLESVAAKLISGFALDWIVPAVLCCFAWKALPRPEAPWLILITATMITATLFTLLRRISAERTGMRRALTLLFFLTFSVSTVELGARFFYNFSPFGIARTLKLRKATLSELDLSSLDFRGAIMTEAELNRSVLSGANLTNANLTNAELKGANLTDANLTNANLTDAKLEGANLTRADLTRANLSYANLTEADLSYAKLSETNLIGATLTRANLRAVNVRDTTRALTKEQLDDAITSGFDIPPGDCPCWTQAELAAITRTWNADKATGFPRGLPMLDPGRTCGHNQDLECGQGHRICLPQAQYSTI